MLWPKTAVDVQKSRHTYLLVSSILCLCLQLVQQLTLTDQLICSFALTIGCPLGCIQLTFKLCNLSPAE